MIIAVDRVHLQAKIFPNKITRGTANATELCLLNRFHWKTRARISTRTLKFEVLGEIDGGREWYLSIGSLQFSNTSLVSQSV